MALIRVEEIREGDRFVADGHHHWTAAGDAGEGKVLDSDDEVLVTLPVRFADGGYGVRVWDPGTEIEVER
jgi:hypothetical protein